MLFFACEPPYSRVHHTRSHCIYSKGPLQCNRLWWPRAWSLDTAGHSEWLCFNNSKSGQSGHLYLFLLSGGCPSNLFRNGVCCYPVSSAPDHMDVSWLSTFFELRSFLVPVYEEYTTWKLPQKKNISEENRSRVAFFLLFWMFYKVKPKLSTTRLESSKEVPNAHLYGRTHCHSVLGRPAGRWVQMGITQINQVC